VNALASNKLLNDQLESNPVISSARTARASREVQSDAQQREAAQGRAIKRRKKPDDPVNITEAVRIGAPTCDVNAHLNYVTATGIDAWNGDPEHVIDVIPSDFTKPDIEDQWNYARQLEDAMVAKIIYSSVCACCGHRCPHRDMQICLTNTNDPNILEILISCEKETIKRTSRIRLSISPNDYVIHDSSIGKSVFDICNLCHKSLSKAKPKLLEMCLKTHDVGPWPSVLF
jgi:hypothetical protein